MTVTPQQRIDTATEYYRRADAGRPDTLDLFTEDVELYFPKFGVRRGKEAVAELAIGLIGSIASIAHDLDSFRYVSQGQTVVVEGRTSGADQAGNTWEGGRTPGGRFASVFDFNGPLISRMSIYLDPDYAGLDADRFLWGRDRTW
ncbi:nuclear transport factor 2 family protein [Actinomadura fibrosa]|uniref:Nuclear transport factor 2 family protein n=1 Tax=Actinomadura fibrosa TaxID=111802 RepID=A0ABW2XM26_9ACTN|nr:nuclear transport factor 2 family protein [Actinomadura fibrosa]